MAYNYTADKEETFQNFLKCFSYSNEKEDEDRAKEKGL